MSKYTNWFATNYSIKGNADELNRLAESINKMKGMRPSPEYGRYWLGNLASVFGERLSDSAGLISTDAEAPAWFSEEKDCPQNALFALGNWLYFSVIFAGKHNDEFERMLKKYFPSIEIYWKACDFEKKYYKTNDVNDTADIQRYHLNDNYFSSWYTKKMRNDFIEDIKVVFVGISIPENVTDEYLSSVDFHWELERIKKENRLDDCNYIEVFTETK